MIGRVRLGELRIVSCSMVWRNRTLVVVCRPLTLMVRAGRRRVCVLLVMFLIRIRCRKLLIRLNIVVNKLCRVMRNRLLLVGRLMLLMANGKLCVKRFGPVVVLWRVPRRRRHRCPGVGVRRLCPLWRRLVRRLVALCVRCRLGTRTRRCRRLV